MFIRCINLEITGSGTANPPGVLGTALYKQSDAGILFDIYKKFTSLDQYPIPGPPLYSGAATGGGAAPPAPAPASSAAPSAKPITTRVAAVVPSATAAPVSAAPAPVASGKGKNCKVKRWVPKKHARDFAV
jgi:hypothetical protein